MLYKYFPLERRNNTHVYARDPELILRLANCRPTEIKPVSHGYIFFYLPGEDRLGSDKYSGSNEGIVPMAELKITPDFSVFVTQKARSHFERAKEALRESKGPLHRVDLRLELSSLVGITISTFVPEDIAIAFVEYDLS